MTRPSGHMPNPDPYIERERDDRDDEPDDDDCMCEFPSQCAGYGYIACRGCGGDFCVCLCGGESDCGGCPACIESDPTDYDD